MTIAWQEPAPRSGPEHPGARYVEVLRRVRTRPAEWALIKAGKPEAVYATATALKLRQWHVPPGDWEFTVREFRRGVHVGGSHRMAQLYARYMGGDPEFPMGTVSVRARFTATGRRACTRCGKALVRKSNRGPWPVFCERCWSHEPSARSRFRRSA
jgi:hypothetical protein